MNWSCGKSLEKPIKCGEYQESGEPRKCRKLQMFESTAHVVGPAKFVWDQHVGEDEPVFGRSVRENINQFENDLQESAPAHRTKPVWLRMSAP